MIITPVNRNLPKIYVEDNPTRTQQFKKPKVESEAEILEKLANLEMNLGGVPPAKCLAPSTQTFLPKTNPFQQKKVDREYQKSLMTGPYNPFGARLNARSTFPVANPSNNFIPTFKAKEVPRSTYVRPQVKDNILRDQINR